MSRTTVKSLRQRTGKTATALFNLLRRMAVRSTGLLNWKLRGFYDGENNEDIDVEVFQPGGFASRPTSTAKAETIVAMLGGKGSAAVAIATRDATAANAAASDLAAGETTIFTESGARVKIDASGNIEVTPSSSGTVKIGTNPSTMVSLVDGALNASAVDPFTGKTHGVLGNGSSKVFLKKV